MLHNIMHLLKTTVIQKYPVNMPLILKTALVLSAVVALATNGYLNWKKTQQTSTMPREPLQTITNSIAHFQSEKYPDMSKTFVTILYIPPENWGTDIWLHLDTIAGTPKKILLVHHPFFDGLDWQFIQDRYFTLYQKNPTYKSITEFIKSPPDQGKILADPEIITEYTSQIANLHPLGLGYNLTEYDYVLTTYRKPYVKDGITVYEAVLDASNALINNQDKLSWRLIMPGVMEEHPIQIKGVKINYHYQPSQNQPLQQKPASG